MIGISHAPSLIDMPLLVTSMPGIGIASAAARCERKRRYL
jgi:hypothetical protein